MADQETAGYSVRGRGWVKFDEEEAAAGGTTNRRAENEESPTAALEVHLPPVLADILTISAH